MTGSVSFVLRRDIYLILTPFDFTATCTLTNNTSVNLTNHEISSLYTLGAVYMGDGTFFYPGCKNCLYERREEMFAGTGRFSSWVYMRKFSFRDDFTRDNLQSQHNIVQAKRDGVFI